MAYSRISRFALVATLVFGAVEARAQSLKLVGVDGTTKMLSRTELAALPQAEVTDSSDQTGVAKFRGPTVRSLVSLVGAPEGHALRGPSMTLVVIAEAKDNYKVAYSLGELDSQFGGRNAIVALTQNGQQIPDDQGPYRIVIQGEEHHARWIRQLVTLRLVRADRN